MPKVSVIMGSQSDLPVLEMCIKTLEKWDVEVDVQVLSAHRTPDLAAAYARSARDNGVELLIAAAGKAAHLAGVLASMTTLPVIGVPIKSSTMDGLDSLLSMVQMPNGIPVGTMAINGGENAALFAAQVLSLKHPYLVERLEEHRVKMQADVLASGEAVRQKLGAE